MPSLKKKRRAYLPEPPKPFENANKSKHTRKNRWTKASKRYRKMHPLCEVSQHYGYTAPAEHVDHIIRVQSGGSQYDPRNLMSITKELHDYKTGREQHTPVMVAWGLNERGEKIPTDKSQAFEIFKGKFQEGGVP